MRKLIVIVFVLLVCVFGMFYCNNSQPEYPTYDEEPNVTEKAVISGKNYSDVNGISIQASEIYIYPEKTTIVLNWQNDTVYSVAYGEPYWIERLENGEWVSCSLKDNVFTEIAHELPAKELDRKEYTLTGMYEISKPGTYRFLSTCSVDMGETKAEECSVWAEFMLE